MVVNLKHSYDIEKGEINSVLQSLWQLWTAGDIGTGCLRMGASAESWDSMGRVNNMNRSRVMYPLLGLEKGAP